VRRRDSWAVSSARPGERVSGGVPGEMRNDIDYNRTGRLSPAQAAWIGDRQWLRSRLLKALKYSTVIGIGIVAELVLAAAPVLTGALWAAVAMGVCLLAGAGVASVRCARRAFLQRNTPPASDDVRSRDGRIMWSAGRWILVDDNGYPLRVPVLGIPRSLERCWIPRYALPPGRYRFFLHRDEIVAAESLTDPSAWWSVAFVRWRDVVPSLDETDSLSMRLSRFEKRLWHGGAYLRSGEPSRPLPIEDRDSFMRVVGAVLEFESTDLEHNRRGKRSPRQGQGGTVAVVEGTLEFCCDYTTGRWWLLGDHRIRVSDKQFAVVPHGAAYRIFVDDRGQVLSLEPLGGSPSS
jgi:hypothetical protein